MVAYYIDDLNSGYVWSNNKLGVNLYFKFWETLPSYYGSNDLEAVGFRAFNAAMKDAVYDIFSQISTFANITFTETSSETTAQLGFGQARLPAGYEAWAYYPTSLNGKAAGDVWTSTRYGENSQVDPGEEGYYVLMHEIGHALGLDHSTSLPGGEDNTRYTVMSYETPVMPQSYMLYDIATLQHLYVANMSYNTGNNIYALEAGHFHTIWDAGGTDTMSAFGQSNSVIINLQEGTFSSVGATDNIAIAYGGIIENATGGTGNDTFYGNNYDNTLRGYWGDDLYYASQGNDLIDDAYGFNDKVIYSKDLMDFLLTFETGTIIVESLTEDWTGTDTLRGIEEIQFGSKAYTRSSLTATFVQPNALDLKGTTADDTLAGGDGDDRLSGGQAGKDTLDGGDGNDILYGGSNDDILIGNLGNDRLYGGRGNDTLHGNEGNDLVYGDDGDDVLYGGDGDDDLRGGAGNDRLFGEDGDDKLSDTSGDNTLDGGDGNDSLSATGGYNYLYGGNGDDELFSNSNAGAFFYGGEGDDIIRGVNGAAIDTAYFLNPLADYDFAFTDARTAVVSTTIGPEAGTDTLLYIDIFRFDSTSYTRAEMIDIFGPPPIPPVVFNGTSANDVASGAGTNDTLSGSGGRDTLHGADGNDMIYGGDSNDLLYGDAGDDELYGDDGNDLLVGGTGDDELNGGARNDTLYGGDGNDTLEGGAGTDKLYGEAGDDSLDAGDGNDLLDGGIGNDVLAGGTGNDKIYGGDGDDTIEGGDGNDRIYGDDGADALTGGAGNDMIYGGLSDDILAGGDGRDKLYGGEGNDTFVFDASAPLSRTNQDTVADFALGDIIDISALLTAYDPLDPLTSLSDFVHVTVRGRNSYIQVDQDGALNGFDYLTVATLQKFVATDEETMVASGALIV